MNADLKRKVIVVTVTLTLAPLTAWVAGGSLAAAEVGRGQSGNHPLGTRRPSDTARLVNRRQLAADWILRAQKATADGGVSAWYDPATGYCRTSYPEVTGYIIPTMFDLFELTGDRRYRNAAMEMADWITSVQLPAGAVPAMDFKTPYVFDTGQCIAGWLRAYKATVDDRYLRVAEKAGRWLSEMQRKDGSFPLTPFTGSTHTYHSRVSWILLQLHNSTEKHLYRDVATRNLDWALRFQKPNGWCVPTSSETTHFIAYAIRGMLEASQRTGNKAYLRFAQGSADTLLRRQLPDGMLYGAYDRDWKPVVESSCLTGNLQMAVVWQRLYAITGDEKYRAGATRAIDFVLATQQTRVPDPGINGSVAGSHPLAGSYCPNRYLSWATKFLIDALNLSLDPQRALSG